MLTAGSITDEQLNQLRWREAHWLDNVRATTYDEYFQHSLAHYHACVALGVRRARRGGSKAKSRARCAEILNRG